MIFLDTSAVVKRYILELNSDSVLVLMAADPAWSASAIALTEAHVTLCARFSVPALRADARERLDNDWKRVTVVALTDAVLARAVGIGCELGLRTLDSIHLAAAEGLPAGLTFVTFDERQAAAARTLGFVVAP